MSDTNEAAAATTETKRGRLGGWTAEGAEYVRTYECKGAEQATRTASRILDAFHKAERTIEVHLDGSTVTARTAKSGGKPDEDLAKVMKKVAPKAPEKKAAAQARKAKAAPAEGAASTEAEEG